MERRIVTALLLSFLMAMSGCIGNNTSVGSNTDSKIQNDVTFANLSISEQLPLVKVDEILVIEGFAEVTPSNTEFSFEYDLSQSSPVVAHDVIRSEYCLTGLDWGDETSLYVTVGSVHCESPYQGSE